MAPMVSIIVPVYNAQHTLARCVDSILAQTYPHVEIILVNDGSRDNSGDICDEYARRQANVLSVHRENGGESAARNTGIRHANGVYIQHVDSDDWIEPQATERLVAGMTEHEVGLVVCSFNKIIRGEKQPVKLGISGEQPPWRQLMEFSYGLPDALLRFGASWNKLYRRDIMDAHNLWFEETKQANEDAHFNFAYIRHIDRTFFIDEPLCDYVIPDGRLTATTKYRANAFEMNERIYDSIEAAIGERVTPQERRVLNRHYIDKTLIVLKMLCRENDVYSADELRDKVRTIVDHAKLRAALANYHPHGTQENEAIELLAACDYGGVLQYGKEGAKKLYGG